MQLRCWHEAVNDLEPFMRTRLAMIRPLLTRCPMMKTVERNYQLILFERTSPSGMINACNLLCGWWNEFEL